MQPRCLGRLVQVQSSWQQDAVPFLHGSVCKKCVSANKTEYADAGLLENMNNMLQSCNASVVLLEMWNMTLCAIVVALLQFACCVERVGRISLNSSVHILDREKDVWEVKVTFLDGFLLQCCITKVSLTASIPPAWSKASMPTRLRDVGSAEGEHISVQPGLWPGAEEGENAPDFLVWYHRPLMTCVSKQPEGKMQ